MQKIYHRINTPAQLSEVPTHAGIELDIRYHENQLVLHHDPFRHHEEPAPIAFEEFLKSWQHQGTMILNIKTEGVEQECLRLMEKYKIQNWFFLDLSMPYFALYAEHAANKTFLNFSPDNLAVRFSEREALEYALGFKGKARWVWVDCFTHMPLTAENARALKTAGFQICLVSPELQKHDISRISEFKQQLQKDQIHIDAVCTKHPDLW